MPIYLAMWLALAPALASSVAANSPWVQSSPMPYTPAYHAFLAIGSQLYVIGGDIGNRTLSKVLVARVEEDGTVNEWTESPHELPQALAEHAAVVVDRSVYLLGGTNGKTALRTVLSAEIPTSRSIGPWRSGWVLLPEGVRGHSAIAMGRSIYVIGGRDEGGKVRDQVFRSTVDAAGQLQNWERSGSLPQPLAHAATAIAGKQVYLVGGETEGGPVDTVYAGSVSSTGELVWQSQWPLPRPLSRGGAFVNGTTLFYVGGYDGSTPSSATYAARIKDDGSLAEWIGWLPLPKGLIGLRATLSNGRAYLTGGFDGASFTGSVQFLPIDTLAAATPTPTPPLQSQPDVLPVAMVASGLVALISFMVVAIALVVEKRTPA